MKKKLITLSGLVLSFMPVVASAQSLSSCRAADISDMLCRVRAVLEQIVPILVTIGIIYFVWGIISYVIADDEEAKSAGRNRIIYGIIGLAVIVSMWGLVRILTNSLGNIDNNKNGFVLPSSPDRTN